VLIAFHNHLTRKFNRRQKLSMNELDASEIIRILEEPTGQRNLAKKRITEEAAGHNIVTALQQTHNSLTQEILCDIVGDRFEQAAVPVLIQFLYQSSPSLRCSAADALGKIGDTEAGPALLERFSQEEQGSPVRHLLASALGAVNYRQAIPTLTNALRDPDPVLRGSIAWSLGIMCAIEAEDALRLAIIGESEPPGSYTRERMEESLDALEMVAKVLRKPNPKEGIPMLLSVIEHDSPVGARTTSAAWALGKLGAEEARKPLERVLMLYPKGFLAQHLRAALSMIQRT
jgi:HEAT repeat protein